MGHKDSDLGLEFYNLLHAHGLRQLISEPTRYSNLLDLLITNTPLAVLEHGVGDPLHDLDHCLIYGILETVMPFSESHERLLWNYNRGDFIKLNDQLLNIPWDMMVNEFTDLDDSVTMITDVIMQCVRECIPHSKVIVYPRDKPGMTARVKSLFKKTRRLLKRAQRTQSEQDILRHRLVRAEAKTEWRKAQSAHNEHNERKLRKTLNSDRRCFWQTTKKYPGYIRQFHLF